MKACRLQGGPIAWRGAAAMHVERIAEHLLDDVEAVEQREILDHLAVAKAQEICNPVADDAAVDRPFRRLAAERRDVLAIHHNAVGHETEGAQHGRHLTLDQIEHRRLAAMRSAEPQIVDRPADRPLHVVGEKRRDPGDVTGGVGGIERLDDGARHGIAHSATPCPTTLARSACTTSGWRSTCSTASKLSISERFSTTLPCAKRMKCANR